MLGEYKGTKNKITLKEINSEKGSKIKKEIALFEIEKGPLPKSCEIEETGCGSHRSN